MKALLATLLTLSLSASAAQPVIVVLTAHDALGRTQQAQATLNAWQYSCAGGQCVMEVEYTTDQLFCSAFGSSP